MKKWILLLCLPYLGVAQKPIKQLSCQLKTGTMVYKCGDLTRSFVWTKIGNQIKYYGIDDLKVINLPKKIHYYEKIKFKKSESLVRGK